MKIELMCKTINAYRIYDDNPARLQRDILTLRRLCKVQFHTLDLNLDNVNVHFTDDVNIYIVAVLLMMLRI